MNHEYDLIPQTTLNEIERFVIGGTPAGGFVTHVLCGDLFRAVGSADAENALALTQIAKFIYNNTPALSWGNVEKVNNWIEMKRAERNGHEKFQR